ncbi:low molecular weight phosphotyrosine protein phosphatase [Sporolactobacillus sp. THM7-4]|nr:low molecular weight phosphotyrosine protein phosphatase [Sporolactobacillus sp. THM7-4]
MIRILFVCLGNICRSPMAEAVLRDKVKKAGLEDQIFVDSAGTGDWHLGSKPHSGTRKILDLSGISYEGIRARQIQPSDFDKFDWLVAMDRSNEQDLRFVADQCGKNKNKVVRFMNLLEDHPTEDVPDPYYSGRFDEVFKLVDKGTDVMLKCFLKKINRS